MAMNTNHLLPDNGSTAGPSLASRIDVEHMLQGVGNDSELAAELIDMFQEDLPSMLENLQAAITGEDLEVVNRLAHSLKTPLGLFGASDARDQSHKLELAADQTGATSFPDIEDLFSSLRTEITEVSRELQHVQLAKS